MSEGLAFGNYRLLRRLARGGMAEVFLARQQGVEGFERRVAIKRILPHLSDSAEFRTMFLDEARLAAQLSHPNIIHIYDFGKVDDYYFIAMEYVDGVDLGRLIKQARSSPMPFELIARILADICAGLHYAHNITDGGNKRLNVVHRDVTPQNVLVTYDGIIKVVDFGIAKATWQASRTRPGVVKGKYAYMSPEQVEGRSLDARSDIYSVGICAYELMTGLPLYRRDNVTEAMKEIRDGKPVHPEQHRAGVPHELLSVIKRALETSRDARYVSAAAMQLDLERYLKAATGLATPQLLGDYLRREAPRINEGEILSEPKLEPEPEPPAPELPAPSRAVAGVAVKGGTAPMSSLKQAVTPAYENATALSGASSPPSASAGSSTGGSSTGTASPGASSAEDLTTLGKPLRASERAQSSSSGLRAQQPPPAGIGFGSAEDEDQTRRDTRLPEPPQSGASEQATMRSPKITPPSGERPLPATDKRPSSSDRVGKSGQHEHASRSGQHGARSGPFPGNPLDSHDEGSEQGRTVLPSDRTAMLTSPPPQPAPRQRWPWLLYLLLVVTGGAVVGYRVVLPRLYADGQRTSPDPRGPQPGSNPGVVMALDMTTPGDVGSAGMSDAAPRMVTTALPVQTSATLGVNTRPSGAKVFIDGEALEMLTPVRMLPMTAGPHHVVIERVGYQPREVDVALHPGEHRVLDFELPEERPLDPGNTTSTPGGNSKRKGTPTPRSTGSGFLTAKTVPWSRAYDGARLLGETPLVSIPLREGLHIITFVNPDHQPIKKRITVRVGEETKLSFSLEE